MSDPANQFDEPWKEALDVYFRQFVELLFPRVAAGIDWDREVEPLDKELPKIVPEAETGPGVVDKLVRVEAAGGGAETVFVHVEVQSQADSDLARRMYRYNHRLEERYGSMPVSVAVLGDNRPAWRPTEHAAGRWGCEVRFAFPVAKLLDWRGREEELEALPNPFASFVVAHLAALATDADPAARLARKLAVVKRLYSRGLTRTDIRQLFRLIDWVITLPPLLDVVFNHDIDAFEKEKQMPRISPLEQRWLDKAESIGEERGRLEGRQEAARRLLKLRFDQPGLDLMPRVEKVTDPAALEALLDAITTAPDLAALDALLPA
ncbi:hypothetical protein J0H58_20585 [bacterium]|nr:hypothetical protein [bacterium]